MARHAPASQGGPVSCEQVFLLDLGTPGKASLFHRIPSPKELCFFPAEQCFIAGGAGNDMLKVKFISPSAITLASHH